jgi:hypothetical protein
MASASHQRAVLLHVLALLARALPAFRQSQDLRRVREVYYLEARLHDRLAALQRAVHADANAGADAADAGGGDDKEDKEEEIDHVALREEAACHFFDVSTALAKGVSRASPVVVASFAGAMAAAQ